MIETIIYKGKIYPKFQSEGYASRFAIPYAQQVCKGIGVDVGCNRVQWAFPGSTPIDPLINEWDAMNFPQTNLDYIFSSHCLEHLQNWVDVLDYWTGKLKSGGVLFLYLPDYSQVYWRPWHNRKHKHCFTPEIIKSFLSDSGMNNIFCSGIDLNNSFMIVCEKK